MAPILKRDISRFAPGVQDEALNLVLEANAQQLGGGAGSMFFVKRALDQLSARLPEESSPADVVFEHLSDLRALDSNPKMNLASFVTTSMEEPAKKLIMDSLNVNQIDGNIYSSSRDIERRCVQMLADIFHAPLDDHMGTATVGSTEACLLAGLNMKKRWEEARRAKGLPTTNPNLIISSAYQVCWKKLAAYWDIEMRLGLLEEGGKYTLEPEDVERLADENTIGVVAILGSTYTGHYDNVQALSATCEKLNAAKGWDLWIHVDAASGGFVAPFLMPDLVWDFRLPRVLSISVSGHKSGLVFPGVGWLVLRSKDAFHHSLVFHLSYLGVDQTDITLNFSRPASMICAQYYMLLRMGRRGFELVAQSTTQITRFVYNALEAMGMRMHSARPGTGQPLVVFALPPASPGTAGGVTAPSTAASKEGPAKPAELEKPYTCFELAEKLREKGWSVPAYKLAHNLEHVLVIRLVIRAEFSMLLAEALLKDIRDSLEHLDAHYSKLTRVDRDQIAESVRHLAPIKAPSMKPKPGNAQVVC